MTQLVHEPLSEKAVERSGDRLVYGCSPELVQFRTTLIGGTGGVPSETNTRARQAYCRVRVTTERVEGD
jgi:hypothetical protein